MYWSAPSPALSSHGGSRCRDLWSWFRIRFLSVRTGYRPRDRSRLRIFWSVPFKNSTSSGPWAANCGSPARGIARSPSCAVRPDDGASDSQAKQGVKQAIEDDLAPVRPSEKPAEPRPLFGAAPSSAVAKKPKPAYPRGWPFGEPFYPSRLYEVVLSATDESGTVRLAKSVASMRVIVDGVEIEPNKLGDAVQFAMNQLPFCSAQVEIPDDPEERPQP